MLSRLVIAFLPRSKCLLISWLQSPSAVILEPKKIKSATVSVASPSICYEVMGPGAMIFVFWMLSFKPPFSVSSFTLSIGSLVPLHLLPLRWWYLHIWGYWYFSQQSWFQLVFHPAHHFAWCTLHRVLPRERTGHSKHPLQQHKRRLYTWTSSEGQHWNQIDYILCSQRWRSSIQPAKTRLGADCGSDHELLIAKFRFKLRKIGSTTRPFHYDVNLTPWIYLSLLLYNRKGFDLVHIWIV